MSSKKISDLPAALGISIIPGSDVIIINNGGITKKITVNDLLNNLDDITATGTISSSLTTDSFGIVANSASFQHVKVTGAVTASNIQIDAETLFIGGTSFSKNELDRLKEGKTITTSANKLTRTVKTPSSARRPSGKQGSTVTEIMDDIQRLDAIVNNVDVTTFIQTNVTGAFDIVVNNTSSMEITTSSIDISLPVFLPSITGSTSFTGSTEFSGSTVVSGSFTVTDLLTVLADYGQTGSFGVSGSSTFAGDVNMDGNVNVQDLLTVLSGFNASGSSTNSGSFSNTGSFTNDGTGSFTGSFDVSGSTTFSGSFNQSGSFNSEGDSAFTGSFNNSGSFSNEGTGSFTGSFENSGSFENTGSFRVLTGNQAVEFDAGTGGFAVNNLLDLLANFSSSGVEGGVTQGDINLDGQVNVNDLLLGLSGYGNPNTIANNILIPPNINHQYIGPTITILSPVSMSISTGSFVSITN